MGINETGGVTAPHVCWVHTQAGIRAVASRKGSQQLECKDGASTVVGWACFCTRGPGLPPHTVSQWAQPQPPWDNLAGEAFKSGTDLRCMSNEQHCDTKLCQEVWMHHWKQMLQTQVSFSFSVRLPGLL